MTRLVLLFAVIACGITVQRESKKSEPSIAVIGAGIAGLSAARRLTELGMTNVHLYEGMNRIGGRIHPIPYQDGYLQMGAQFINGDRNPIYDMARDLGVLAGALPDTAQFERATFYTGNQNIDPADLKLFTDFTGPLDQKYRELAKNHDLLSRVYTIKTIFMEDYHQFLKKNNITGQRRKVFDAMTRSYRSYWEFEWAADWDDLSPRVLTEFHQMGTEGDSYMTDKIGYKAILDHIEEHIPITAFRFNQTVTNIDYSQTGAIYITTLDGIVNTTYDYVIVTSSLGHLKKFHRKLFTPILPRQKVQAIEKIGFGGNCKIFFKWDKPFWANGTHYIAPLPIEGMARNQLEPFEREMNTLEVMTWAPNTLMAFVAGAGHKIMDELSDKEISDRITRLVRDMAVDQTIQPPSQIIRTKLTKNELILGSYSYLSAAQARAGLSHSRLAIPVKQHGKLKILFAGEATHHRLFQTAIGAYLSGRREADRIQAELKELVKGTTEIRMRPRQENLTVRNIPAFKMERLPLDIVMHETI